MNFRSTQEMKFEEKIERTLNEATFWIKREMSITLLFWLAVVIAVLIGFLFINT
jgi:uncharacterized membrane protein